MELRVARLGVVQAHSLLQAVDPTADPVLLRDRLLGVMAAFFDAVEGVIGARPRRWAGAGGPAAVPAWFAAFNPAADPAVEVRL